mgnify:CR=1 FL=1
MASGSNFSWHSTTITNNEDLQKFFNQRFRTWIAVIPNSEVEAYLQAEMGHIVWGSNFEWPKTYVGPRFPASADPNGDRVGVELRRAYLTYKHHTIGTFRVGIQDWHDGFGGISTMDSSRAVDDYDSFGAVLANSIWDFNVGGISFNRKIAQLHNLDLKLGIFQIWEGDVYKADDVALFALDADLPINEKDYIGFSIYYMNDHGLYSYPTAASYYSAWDFWAGIRAKKEISSLSINGVIIFNSGTRKNISPASDFEHNGWAGKIEGNIPVGPGKVGLQALFSTGDDNPADNKSHEFRTIAQSERDNFGSQGYWSYLHITTPNGPSDVNDLGVGLQNRGLGLFTIQAKYDYPLLEKFRGTFAAGWLRSAENNPINGNKDIGIEIANAFVLDLGGGMTLDFGGAYLWTGDFYRTSPVASSPDNLWEAFGRMQLEF